MHQNLGHLMKTRRFLPLFITQFLGALNDNLFKQALVLLAVFGMAENAGLLSDFTGQIAVIAGGLFIVPFFLFSATAGQLADKFEKAALIRCVKLAEIAIMTLAAIGFLLDPAYITLKVLALMAVLFFMGVQSAFFGPLKYAILPTHLRPEELVGGNGLIEAATFLAILIGTIAGGLLILQPAEAEPLIFGPFQLVLDGKGIIALSILLIAIAGWIASWFIPSAAPADPNLRVRRNILVETARVVAYARSDRRVFLSILGISWFWLIGITFISLLAPFVGEVLGAKGEAGSHVTTLMLTLFSIGIAIGSLMTNRLLKGEISAKYVPIGALGISLSILALFFSVKLHGGGGEIGGVLAFLQDPTSWPILISLSLIAVFGGFYIVPLYAIMQHYSNPKRRARVIAGNNILNALFMTVSSLVVAVLLSSGVSIPAIFLLLAILNFGVALYICKLLPEAVVKPLVAGILKLLYKVELRGVENYAKAGPRAVIVANHVSWLDGMLLAAFLPRKPVIAVDTHTAIKWWATPFLSLVEFYPIDPTNPLSTKSLIKEVRAERHCVIFPEGRLTTTGALMKVYEGPGMIADKADADILPVHIDGAQFCKLSRLKGKTHLKWFPKITLTILPPGRFEVPEGLVGRQRREVIGGKLYDLMSDMVFRTCNHRRTLFQALIDAGETYGPTAEILGDAERHTLDYKKLIQSSFVLGHRFTDFTQADENVGLLLPNTAGGAVAFFALQAFCRVPAMLNFTAGARAMDNACRAAGIKRIITSRRFVQMAKLEADLEILAKGRSVHYLEDIREEIGLADKAYGFLSARMASRLHNYNVKAAKADPDSPAVVLFTSGSEGLPKAVVLSHANLLANAHQLGSRIDFNPSDTVFNALPLFHSFGLSSGLLLPLLSGVKVFLYPSPLHYRIIPELVYGTNATILFGTDTFLSGYARVAHPYDFYSLRYVFAGAERVKDSTRRAWSEKFGHRILEGYGATETSPVISTNTPMHYRAGTVGRLLPGIEAKLEAVPGIEEGGRLYVHGPNVMLGYYRVDAPLELERPKGGWYDTGDIVEIDASGFITIKGRVKRFAKIAGEMVSLSAVEEAASALWPDSKLAAINLPDERKGEQVYLLIDRTEATREEFVTHARKKALPELMVPRQVLPGVEIPLLGSGKIDYNAAKIQAEDLVTGKLPGLTPG